MTAAVAVSCDPLRGQVASGFPPPAATSLDPVVSLEEVSFEVLPAGFHPTGMTVDANGPAMLWSGPSDEIVLRIDRRWERVESVASPVGGCLHGDTVLVFDARGSAWSFGSPLGPVERRFRVGIAQHDSLVAAVCADGRGYVLSKHGELRSFAMTPPHDVLTIRDRWPEMPGVAPDKMFMSLDAGDLLITAAVFPYAAVRIDPATGHAWGFDPITNINLPSDVLTGDGIWRSLPLLRVGRSYLRTLVDGQTDRRLLILYDECGVGLRTRSLRAPIGFVASSATHVFAVRHTGRAELVQYNWTQYAPRQWNCTTKE